MVTRESLNVIYQESDLFLGDADGRTYLIDGERSFWLSDHPYEPCLYVKSFDGTMLTIHHAFTVDELQRAVQDGSPVRMITGNEYDIHGICRLLLKAVELCRDDVDIGYVEGHVFMDFLKQQAAVSPETAVDPAAAGIRNPRMMNPFLHSKKISCTADGRFYLRGSALESGIDQDEDCFRVISNLVRFGCGYRTVSGQKQYYAWHGYPNRNDDFITYAEISRNEYLSIDSEYPREIEADRETAEQFRRKYVNGHRVLKEGWNVSL